VPDDRQDAVAGGDDRSSFASSAGQAPVAVAEAGPATRTLIQQSTTWTLPPLGSTPTLEGGR
jgi:hypothetical protein